jgi:opine dehydrogenase
MPQTTVAIIGAGIGGVYLAAELGLLGCKLRLHDRDDSRLINIRARGGIEVEGERGGFAAIERVTTDPAAAVDGAEIIVIVTGGTFQEGAARDLAPHLRDGQIVLLIQGNTGGCLVVRRALDRAGCRASVDIAEMDNYPYSCWRLGPARIRPIVKKRWLQIATFPGNRIAAVFAKLSPLFPEAVAAPSIVSTGFMNANAMLHVANCVGNAGRIDNGEAYKFYAEGVTPAVARLYRAINAERAAVAAAFGASAPNLEDWFERAYGVRGTRSLRDLPAADHQQRRPLPGDRHPQILGPQIHRRGCAGRARADARARRRGRGADPGDRFSHPHRLRDGRQRLRRRGAHLGAHGSRRHEPYPDPRCPGARLQISPPPAPAWRKRDTKDLNFVAQNGCALVMPR